MCFVHSLTSKTNTHGPGEMFLSTGFTAEGYPEPRLVGLVRARDATTTTCPPTSRSPTPGASPSRGRRTGRPGSCRRSTRGPPSTPTGRSPTSGRPAGIAEGDDRATRGLPQAPQRRAPEAQPRRRRTVGPDRLLRAGRPDAARGARGRRPRRARARRRRPSTASTTPTRSLAGFGRNCLLARRLLERGVRFVTLFNGAFAMGEGNLNWDGHRRIKSDYDRHGPILDQPRRGPAARPEGARAARRHAGPLDHRVRPDADLPEGDRGPRPQPDRLHRLAGRRRRQAGLQLRGDRRVRPQGGRATSSTSTTSTPPSSTCSASTTSG